MSQFKIALLQYPLTPFKSESQWQSHILKWCKKAVQKKARLIVFPEYGSLELVSLDSNQKSLQAQLLFLQKYHDTFMTTFKNISQKLNCAIVAPSFPLRTKNNKFINRSYIFNSNGICSFQDKNKMTRFEDEVWGVSSPESEVVRVFDLNFVKVGISICFDSEFPTYAAKLAHSGCELLLVPSCTEALAGHHRVHTGSKARALENQFYVAVSPLIKNAKWCPALDKNTGAAALYGPSDRGFPANGEIKKGRLNKPSILVCEINTDKIHDVRSNGAVFNFKKSKDLNNLLKNIQVETISLL